MKLTRAEITMILFKSKFKFAFSMPKIPHEYTLKEDWYDKELFEKTVQAIRDNGVKEKFYKKTFTYFYANGYKYWTMGNPIVQTKLINRAKVESKN